MTITHSLEYTSSRAIRSITSGECPKCSGNLDVVFWDHDSEDEPDYITNIYQCDRCGTAYDTTIQLVYLHEREW